MRLKKFIRNRKELRGAIFGTMLGDGYIRNLNKHKTKKGEFRFTHSPEQEDYLDFKKELFEMHPLITCKKTKRTVTLKKTNKEYEQIELTSNANTYAGFIGGRIYKNNQKAITEAVLNEITDLGLFLWYLDDGYLNIRRDATSGKIKEYRVFLYTNCFYLYEVILIQQWMKNKYGIEPNINKKEKRYEDKGYILYFNSKKTRKLMEIFDPYSDIVPSMRRKILKYNILP